MNAELRDGLKIVIGLVLIGVGFGTVRSCTDSQNFFRVQKNYAEPGEKIDLNRASSKELRRLPGIGPVYADRIIQNRPYRSKEEVMRKVPEFGRDRWLQIADFVKPFQAQEYRSPVVPTRWPPTVTIKNGTSRKLRFLFMNANTGALILELQLSPWEKIEQEPIQQPTARIAVMDRNTEICSGDYTSASMGFTINEINGKVYCNDY